MSVSYLPSAQTCVRVFNKNFDFTQPEEEILNPFLEPISVLPDLNVHNGNASAIYNKFSLADFAEPDHSYSVGHIKADKVAEFEAHLETMEFPEAIHLDRYRDELLKICQVCIHLKCDLNWG
jgi:hypothetical protein